MRQWNGSALVQVMACRLFGANPLPEPMLPYCQNWNLPYCQKWNLNQNTKYFIQENALENVVCEMAVILFRGRWVKVVLMYIIGHCVQIKFGTRIHQAVRRLATSSHEVTRPEDFPTVLRFERTAALQHCCRDICKIAERSENLNLNFMASRFGEI